MVIQRAYKLRLYPNKEQEQKLLQILGACRFIYNYYLEQRKNYYFENKKTLPYAVMSRDLTKLRYKTDWLSQVQALPIQQSLRRLDTAYNRFFRKQSKFPRFKSKKDIRQSFQKNKDWRLKENKVQIQQDITIRYRGMIDPKAKLGTLVVSRHASGKWFATITAEVVVKQPKRYTKPIGIDVGIETLATLSTGKKYDNLRPQETLQRKLTLAQRSLTRKKKGSNRREKARKKVAHVYEKICNVRENYLHNVSYDITRKNHAVIAVEDLNVAGMMKSSNLARVLVDASMRELLRQLEYKQEWRGGEFVKIDRFFPSSKCCSKCNWVIASLPLHIRKWECEKCGAQHDRDINAAKVILKQSLAHSERGESERVSPRRESPLSVKR